MLYRNYLLLILGLTSFCTYSCNGDRIKDTMYINIKGSVACYRRMNSTHQIGCSSERGGSVGVVHYCDNQSDLDFILNNGTAGKYIPILPTSMLNANLIDLLVSNKHMVSGVVLHSNNEKLKHFSHESKCPNEHFSVESAQCPANGWNPWGTNLLYRDIPFPMFYIEDQHQIEIIKECYQVFNNFSYSIQTERALCSLELNAFMYATTNTPTCQRRSNIFSNLNPVKFCDPLGDSNIWGSIFPLVRGSENNTEPIRDVKYIVVAARMDTTSLFEKTSGAETPVTGLVALLTVAKLLKEMLPSSTANLTKNVLFILFNGETYDYIGSQRLLYDMELGQFPTDLPEGNDILPTIYPKDISLFIELSQLAAGSSIYAHYLDSSDIVTDFLTRLSKNAPQNVSVAKTDGSLPPSSLHTFLRGKTTIQGLVLTDHGRLEYRNPFYNSLYDNASNIEYEYRNGTDIDDNSVQKYIGDVALMVAKSVFEEVIGSEFNGKVAADLALVDELFHCYLEDPHCKVHKAIQKTHLPTSPPSLYVGVTVVDNFITSLVALTLAWFTGDMVGPSGPNCTNLHKNHVYRYYNMSFNINQLEDMRCFRATINLTDAVSPAFIIEDYDWSSDKYSSWSESTWNDLNMRLFLRPSRVHEKTTLSLGFITMLFSFVVVYWMKSRCHILFDYPAGEDPPANC